MRRMGFLSVLSMAHKLVEERVRQGDCVVDGTVGGGNDTLFLARLVGSGGRVIGFDIQEAALDRARERIARDDAGDTSVAGTGLLDRVTLIADSHARMAEFVPADAQGDVAAVMFNLGYLPGGDRSVITSAASTLPALEAALGLLRSGGVVTVVVYPGHAGGDAEAEAVSAWSASLPQADYQTLVYRFANPRNTPPYLIAIEKR